MTTKQIATWQSNLGTDFYVDTNYAIGYKMLKATKKIVLDDTFFIELSIYYTNNRHLMATIELIKVISSTTKKNFFLGTTVHTLYDEVLSKETRLNNRKIYLATKEGYWLDNLTTWANIYKSKLERGESLYV